MALCLCMAVDAMAYPTHHIGLREGLSNDFAVDMVMDGQGMVWVATESGLNRIAGGRCTVFRTSNSGVSSDEYVGMYYDVHANKIWMHSKTGKVDVYDCVTQRFRPFAKVRGMYSGSVADVSGAADGGVWLAYYDGTLQHYDTQTGAFSTVNRRLFPMARAGVRSITDDGRGHLYVGLRMDGMYVYGLRTGKATFYNHDDKVGGSLPGDNVRCVYTDHRQNVWIGTNRGLALFDCSTGRFRTFRHHSNDSTTLAGDNVHSIMETKDGQLWVSSDVGGVSVLDIDRYPDVSDGPVAFRRITKEDGGLSSNNVRRVVQDAFGNIWIANYSTGVDFLPCSTSEFHALAASGAVIDNVIGLYGDRQGNLWIGQDNVVIQYRDGRIVRRWNFASSLSGSSASVYVFEKDRQGRLWLGTGDNGVLYLDTRTGGFTHVGSVRNLDVHALHEDADGRMWIGTESGLYSVCNGVERREDAVNRQMGGSSPPVVYSIVEDRHGQFWVGTLARGVYVFDRKKRLVAHLDRRNGLGASSVNHIVCDNDGAVWLATFNGVACIADPLRLDGIRIYDGRHGLKDSHIRALCLDRLGNVWVSMFSGIACLDVRRGRFYNFDYRDGIPMGNFVEASAAVASDGTVYFGSPGGICFFDPRFVTEHRAVSPVQITGCERLGRQSEHFVSTFVSPADDGGIHLGYDDNTFKMQFAVMDFAQDGNVEYSYMMKGLDDQWYETDGRNEVVFRNLKPGDYTFVVRAKLKNQEWAEAETSQVEVTVHPPLWLTWWAKLLYAFILCSVAYYLLRSYRKEQALRSSLEHTRWESGQKQRLNEERLRFFTNVTHELRTPLTLILGPLEDMLEDRRLPDVMRRKVRGAYDSAAGLLGLINDIMEFRRTETHNRRLTVARGDIGELVREAGERFRAANRNPDVEITVSVQPDIPEVYHDSEVVGTVISNLMSNAIKYTPRGSVRLSVAVVDGNSVRIAVEDTGYGIPAEALPHVFERYYQANGRHQASGTGIGLALVSSLAVLHEAQVGAESTEGVGSRFTFSLDIDNTYPDALHKDAEERMPCETADVVEKEDGSGLPVLLVVEDNGDIRQYIADSLHYDYRVVQAADGREGLELALRMMPEIIVSDVMMPEMDGMEMMKALKADIRTSHIPVVLLTAKTASGAQEEGYDCGADSYLTKPFSARLLRSRIRNILSARRRFAEYVAQRNAGVEKSMAVDGGMPGLSELDRAFLDKLDGLIKENMAVEELNMAFMTDRMAMSHSTLYRKIRALTGMSANEYIRKAKLGHSMRLLESGAYTVAEAATMTGFNNLGNFRESFKAEYGVLPSEVLRAGRTPQTE